MMTGRRFLIVNADDFNLTPAVSRGIITAHKEGIVTSTTVMINLPSLEENAPLLAQFPSLGVGLHVNLTFGPPVSSPDKVPSLVDGNGQLIRDPKGLAARARLEEVALELTAQRKRFEQVFSRSPSHVDSHHHVHHLEPLDRIFLDSCRKWGSPLRSANLTLREKARSLEIPTPDHFVGDVGEAPYWSEKNLGATLESLPEGITELMCHPGYWENSSVTSSYNIQREGERTALCSPGLPVILNTRGIILVTFAALEKGPPATSRGMEI